MGCTEFLWDSDDVEDERQHNESEGKPLGGLCELSVQSLSLALTEEGVSTAGNRAGEAGTLAALHKNDDGDSEAGKNLKNS